VKHKRFFSILAVAVILSLLMVAIPALPASAVDEEQITLDVEKGETGDEVTVSGTDFLKSVEGTAAIYYVDIYFSRNALDVGDTIEYYDHIYALVKGYISTDDDGEFSKTIEIPAVLSDSKNSAVVQGGTYYFYVTYLGEEVIKAYAEFTVIGITDFSPISGPVGTEVEMGGVGFDGNDDIHVFYDSDAIEIASGGGDRRFKSNGSFTSRVIIPQSIAGVHTLRVEDDGGHSGQFEFTVEPKITLNPAPASVGDEVTITGTGFGEDSDLIVYFDGDVVYITGDYDTSDWGSFESSFIVPELAPGDYLVEVEDEAFNLAEALLEVGPGLDISPVTSADAPGHVGDTVELSGSGFLPNHELTITYSSTPVQFTTTSFEDGSFSYSLVVPPSPAGEHAITVSDGTSTKGVSFFMEAVPPEAPEPLLPELDAKADSKTEFDWTDVSDASMPMTYELQVSINSQFTVESILVSKIALTTSTYTLTEEEELESVSEEAPYYWRVRAKDAASNQSVWSSGTRFTVGGGFSMPGWLTYTLIALGAIFIFFLGLWLGRRSATSEDYYDF
jgi:hypothetical protein